MAPAAAARGLARPAPATAPLPAPRASTTPLPRRRAAPRRPSAAADAADAAAAPAAAAAAPSAAAPPPAAAARACRIANVASAEVGVMLADGWTLLDVRPPHEAARAPLLGALEVPLFVVDDAPTLANAAKQLAAGALGGWWLGSAGHMRPNPAFLPAVRARVPADARVLLVCQRGLRSLAAAEQLAVDGYGAPGSGGALAWLPGGLDTARPGEVPTRDGVDVRVAGIGGLSAALCWTEAQQDPEAEGGAGEGAGSEAEAGGARRRAPGPPKALLYALVANSAWLAGSLYIQRFGPPSWMPWLF
jgi:rhodanese-related sulfurtransferase